MSRSLTSASEFRMMLSVPDFAARRDFYTQTLGWSIQDEWDRGVGQRGAMFDTGCGLLEIFDQPDARPRNDEFGVALRVDDVWKLWNSLKDSVPLAFPLRDNAWGDTSFGIYDPGGFQLVFFTATPAAEC